MTTEDRLCEHSSQFDFMLYRGDRCNSAVKIIVNYVWLTNFCHVEVWSHNGTFRYTTNVTGTAKTIEEARAIALNAAENASKAGQLWSLT